MVGGDDSHGGASDSSTPLLARVLDLDVQLEVTLQWAKELNHLRTKVTDSLTEVFQLEQAMLIVAVMLQDQVREAEVALEEADQNLKILGSSQTIRVE